MAGTNLKFVDTSNTVDYQRLRINEIATDIHAAYSGTAALSVTSITIGGNPVTGGISSTDNLPEGSSNLYFTSERVDDRVNTLVTAGTGITKVYDDTANTYTLSVTQADINTDNITEGSTNLFTTSARTRGHISVAGSLAYNSGTGVISYTTPNSDGITEGSTNLYFTNERVDDRINNLFVAGTGITRTYDDAANTYQMSIGQAVATTSAVTFDKVTLGTSAVIDGPSIITIDPANAGSSGKVVIAGDLQVTGSTTTIDSTTLTTADLAIRLAKDAANAAAADGAGLEVKDANLANFKYDNTNGYWESNIPIKATSFVGIDADKISEGNSKAEIIDTGSDGRFTVETEGSERLLVNKDGKVSIGDAATHTYGAHAEGDDLVIGGAGWRGMTIYGEGGGGVIQFADAAGNRDGQIMYSHGDRKLIFRTAGNSDRLQIDSSGHLILNGGKIYGSDQASNVLDIRNTSGNANHARIEIGQSVSNDNGGIHFYTAGSSTASQRMVIRGTSGKIGIGTDNPAEALTVQSSANDTARIQAHGISCRDNWGITTGLGNGMCSPAANTLVLATNSVERLRIDSDGQIKKTQGANVTSLKTYNSNTDAFWLDHYQYQSSGTYQRYTDIVSIGDGTWGSNIRFFTNANGSANGIERLRITSAGDIGLGGITTPLWTTGGGMHLNDNYGIGFGNGGSGRPDFQIVTTGGATLDLRCGFGGDTADITIGTDGTVTIPAVAGTNNNHNSDVLFQTSAGVIDGGSGLTYNPAQDALYVNGLSISGGGINGSGSSLILSCANHSSTCKITVGSVITTLANVEPSADNADNLGSSSKRWANVYTADLQMNNTGTGGNEVDGSEGCWTMQEGADDLFLINRNTGKKYKFNLTEVS